ncbi:MAG: hypothetical protein M1827_003165 [Pycnora praestabilis]|nr:MAG: hypothetical protein M1827_003165 [Pycnora praestabilis]
MLKRLRDRLDSWVMLAGNGGFVPLPSERILYTSPPRTTLTIQTPNTYPGKSPLAITSSAGCVYLTNQRIVYLPASPTPHLKSFSAPILNLHDTHVSAPFFGPNVWTGTLQPTSGGGIPPTHAIVELKMTFKEGGAFDFHSNFERINERLHQAVDMARESGQTINDGIEQGGMGGGAMAGVNMAAVHLDELPAYEAPSAAPPLAPMPAPRPRASPQSQAPAFNDGGFPPMPNTARGTIRPSNSVVNPPNEPPPGYEEVQRDSVANELEGRLRRSH